MNTRTALATLAFLTASSSALATEPADLSRYIPLNQGICEDVQLPCVKAILKTTDMYYVVFKDGKPIAITVVHANGKEEVVWGELKLPLKPGEKEI